MTNAGTPNYHSNDEIGYFKQTLSTYDNVYMYIAGYLLRKLSKRNMWNLSAIFGSELCVWFCKHINDMKQYKHPDRVWGPESWKFLNLCVQDVPLKLGNLRDLSRLVDPNSILIMMDEKSGHDQIRLVSKD